MLKPKLFEIGTVGEFRSKYSEYFEKVFRNQPPINPEVVPDNLKHLIPYAQQWGISNGIVRERFCREAPPEMVSEFKRMLAGTHPLFEEWSYERFFTDEDEPEQTWAESRARLSADEQYAQGRFLAMYVTELEEFDGKGLRGFMDWFKATDPEGYEEWVKS